MSLVLQQAHISNAISDTVAYLMFLYPGRQAILRKDSACRRYMTAGQTRLGQSQLCSRPGSGAFTDIMEEDKPLCMEVVKCPCALGLLFD